MEEGSAGDIKGQACVSSTNEEESYSKYTSSKANKVVLYYIIAAAVVAFLLSISRPLPLFACSSRLIPFHSMTPLNIAAVILKMEIMSQELPRKALAFPPPATTSKSWPSHRSALQIPKISHSISMDTSSRLWECSELGPLSSGTAQANPSKLMSKKLSFEQSSVVKSGAIGRRVVTIRQLLGTGGAILNAGLGWWVA